MTALLDRDDTVLPTEEDSKVASESSRILASQTAREDGELRVTLADGQTIVLPNGAARLLSHLLTEMGRGNAVTIIPVHAELTTQEAADYLSVSRPYLIRLLEAGNLPFSKIGTHRRVKFEHLKAYKERLEKERENVMKELAAQAQELGMGY